MNEIKLGTFVTTIVRSRSNPPPQKNDMVFCFKPVTDSSGGRNAPPRPSKKVWLLTGGSQSFLSRVFFLVGRKKNMAQEEKPHFCLVLGPNKISQTVWNRLALPAYKPLPLKSTRATLGGLGPNSGLPPFGIFRIQPKPSGTNSGGEGYGPYCGTDTLYFGWGLKDFLKMRGLGLFTTGRKVTFQIGGQMAFYFLFGRGVDRFLENEEPMYRWVVVASYQGGGERYREGKRQYPGVLEAASPSEEKK